MSGAQEVLIAVRDAFIFPALRLRERERSQLGASGLLGVNIPLASKTEESKALAIAFASGPLGVGVT